MTAQFFPNVEQILDILMAEMPAGVYAEDRADNPDTTKRSVSSSEIRAHAQLFANLYDNLDTISSDKFVSTVTAGSLARWEADLFSEPQDPTQSFAVRQANLLAKLRLIRGINYASIFSIVDGILTPLGLPFSIFQFNGCGQGQNPGGGWILSVSALGLSTYLAAGDPLLGAGRDPGITPLDCNLNYAAAGITAQQLADIQATAYTYGVQIYGIADAATLAALDAALTKFEPARSTHIITNNAVPPPLDPDILDLGPFVEDTLADVIDCGSFTMPPAYDVYDFGGFV